MPRPSLGPRLIRILSARGPSSAQALCAELKTRQPTFSRLVARHPEILSYGGPGRPTTYALPREVGRLGARFPVYRVDLQGNCKQVADLRAVAPSGFLFAPEPKAATPYAGIPRFLDDVRPQGFLGRAFSSRFPELALPDRLQDWGEAHILAALSRRGEDQPGDLLVGAESCERWHEDRADFPIESAERGTEYSKLADRALAGDPGGSSAAGEQPKFAVRVRNAKGDARHALVKFSGDRSAPKGERWADLLISEHWALRTLAEEGLAAAESELVFTDRPNGGRVFLEVIRFDRAGRRGRVGVLSLSAVNSEYLGGRGDWVEAAGALGQRRALSETDARTLRRLDAFSRWIANTDRHPGNILFFWDPHDWKAERLRLAPAYDVLPMLYAPTHESDQPLPAYTLPRPNPEALDELRETRPWALKFWLRVADDPRISALFRDIAARNAKLLRSP